jgi:hypothetical protein
MPLLLYPQGKKGKNPWYPFDRRLGGPQSQSGQGGEEKIFDPNRTHNSDPLINQPVGSYYPGSQVLSFMGAQHTHSPVATSSTEKEYKIQVS